jgi:hypothetical protein
MNHQEPRDIASHYAALYTLLDSNRHFIIHNTHRESLIAEGVNQYKVSIACYHHHPPPAPISFYSYYS